MLNGGVAEQARNELQNSVDLLAEASRRAMERSVELHELRAKSSHKLIPTIEAFVNSLAATPKEFDKTFRKYQVELASFDGLVQAVDVQRHDAEVKGSVAAGTGTALGLATVAGAPAAAMAVATTFGTASTGVAISTLSGAAATNAALAWLGGGALAAGGSGIAGGSSLLALAGPVGLGIAAVCLAGGAVFVRSKNTAIAEEANERRKEVEARRRKTDAVVVEITKLRDLTKVQVAGMRRLLSEVSDNAPSDYREFDENRKQALTALVNHVQVLGKLLNRCVGGSGQ